MATTIINPAQTGNDSGNNGSGFLLGVIILIVFVILFFVYIIPYLQHGLGGGAQINVPKDVNVKVQQGK